MNWRRALAIALMCVSLPSMAKTRRHIAPWAPFDVHRILWVGAHPDDEILAAPLLGPLCVERTSQCSMVVVTRGENGSCALPGGCSDLGAQREQEMRGAAAMLRATLTQWSLPDTMTDLDRQWSRDQLIGALRDIIRVQRPTAVLTFDPNHGSTCHPAHRAIGALTLEAAHESGTSVFLLETRALPDGAGFRFLKAFSGSVAVDARMSWQYLLDDLAVHASQFSSDTRDAVAATPPEERVVFLAPAAALVGAVYASPCP
jgi:LmbE family N-acetylglucosaminyl deacetylase